MIITASPLIDPNAEKGLNITNVTVSAVCPLNASLAIDEVSLPLSFENFEDCLGKLEFKCSREWDTTKTEEDQA